MTAPGRGIWIGGAAWTAAAVVLSAGCFLASVTPASAQQDGGAASSVFLGPPSLGGYDIGFGTDSSVTGQASAKVLRAGWSVFDPASPFLLAHRPAGTFETSPQGDGPRGAEKNFGLAAAEVLIVNWIVWAFNEYPRGANFTQVSPRSWYENIKAGFSFDDNHFNTNQIAHPYHGNLYYNAARSNGFGYWASAPFAIAGSFLWECCGETHNMSINDWVATGIGGVALGEMTYRVTSTILDNTASGSGRTWREVGAALLNPVRGFNRLISGAWSEVGQNPVDRMPSHLSNVLRAGVRVIGEGESISDSTSTNAFFEVDFRYGNPFGDDRKDPFDYFLLGLQLNFSEKHLVGRLQVRGNLFTTDLKNTEKVQHIFTVAQNYDYFNNFSYEFGGQSVSASILSRFDLSPKWQLGTAVDGYGMLMGAINSDFAFLAEFPPDFLQERYREYDFGPGAGAGLAALFYHSGRELLMLRYRLNYLYTLNGSVQEGDDAWHTFQWLIARGMVPITRNFGIGADAAVFLRKSHYTCEITVEGEVYPCTDQTQRNPELRVFGSWKVGG
jgi:hypothetical protein